MSVLDLVPVLVLVEGLLILGVLHSRDQVIIHLLHVWVYFSLTTFLLIRLKTSGLHTSMRHLIVPLGFKLILRYVPVLISFLFALNVTRDPLEASAHLSGDVLRHFLDSPLLLLFDLPICQVRGRAVRIVLLLLHIHLL